jgi:hypothetical protein
MTKHPITPPPELVQQWWAEETYDPFGVAISRLATQAARWGADLQPVAVSERMPAAEDCDAEGRCWFHSVGRVRKEWYLLRAAHATETATHWLPANALPTPEAHD